MPGFKSIFIANGRTVFQHECSAGIGHLRRHEITYEESKQFRMYVNHDSRGDSTVVVGFDRIDIHLVPTLRKSYAMAWLSVVNKCNILPIWGVLQPNSLVLPCDSYSIKISDKTRNRNVNAYNLHFNYYENGADEKMKELLSSYGIGGSFDYIHQPHVAAQVYILLYCDRRLLEGGSGLFRDGDHRARVLQLLTQD